MDNRIWDVHPDLALLANTQRREILCLALEDAPQAQLCTLADLGAFCAYRQARQAALLFAQESGVSIPMLEEALLRLGLQAGLSGPFAVAASAKGCMIKAQLALKTGRSIAPGRVLYPMDDYGRAALVRAAGPALSKQGFCSADFCDEALSRMAQVDAERDTQYIDSLYAYLHCGMDMKRAAQAMGVHRNTLAYRMERVQALFGLDLKDVNRCFELLFSLWLMRHLPERLPQSRAAFDAAQAQAALWQQMARSGEDEAEQGGFACALLAVDVSQLADAVRSALILRMQGIAQGQTAFAYDEDVLLAAMPPDALEDFAAQAKPLCKGCTMVITQGFDASRIAQHARLCRMALCAGAGQVIRTRDLCSTLFFMAMERSVSLAPYLCEDVIRVMDDDAQKGGALSSSLYAYLLHFRDLRRAAQQLGVHRNTMEYHVRKIEALIPGGMDEPRRFMMMCTYKMLALPDIGRYGL